MTPSVPSAPEADLRRLIVDVPDFPKKGIVFKDIMPLLADPEAFRRMIEAMAGPFKGQGVAKVAGIESRGFLLASAIAYHLDAGVIVIRKKGKLPRKTVSATYSLEYGTDTIEAHADSAAPGTKVLLVDDVLATGGTAKAACELLDALQAKTLGLSFLIELDFLKGREKLLGRDIRSLIRY